MCMINKIVTCLSHQLAHLGVCTVQINYLNDEAVNVRKGANVIISLVHHIFATYGLGENVAHLHADNCSGQNKNWYNDELPYVKSADWPASADNSILPSCGPYEVLP